MMRKVLILASALAGVLLTVPLFGAQGAAATGGGTATNWVAITSGFAMAIASGLCGLGQGRAAAGACEGLARNPGARPGIQLFLLLALIFIESLALYTLAIIFVKVR
jgi:F-type H+-transporting ATPase subunit c